MKIAMIGQKGVPSRAGGIEIHVEQIAKRLARKGHEVHVFTRSGYIKGMDKKECLYEGMKLVSAPYIHSRHLDAITHTFTSTLKALFRGCDIFHYHALGPSSLSFIPRLLGKKVVCTVHGLDWQRAKWGRLAACFLKFGEYASAKFSHITISVSETLVKYYKKKYRKNIQFISNGTQKPLHEEASLIKEQYGLEKDSYILFLARLVPEKGAHYLIQAYQNLNTSKKLVIAGGESHSGAYVQQLMDQADGDKNILFTGFVEGKVLDELYSNAYIYVLPSDIEGMALSLLEAMSYGNCCLVSNIAENLAVTGSMGFTFKKGDWLDLFMVLSALLASPEKVFRMRKNTASYILDKFSWDKAADKTLALYGSLYKHMEAV